jgi:uncharacterized protein
MAGDPLLDGVEWMHPSPRLVWLRGAEVAFATVVAAVLIGVFTTPYLLAAPLAAGIATAFFLQRRVRAWGYAERDDDLLVSRGVLIARLSVVPYGRMQFIDVTAGVAERVFGLATVRMHTAAAASDARIPGLEPAEAARLRDRLAELGEAQAAGL